MKLENIPGALDVLARIARGYGVTVADVLSPSRLRSVARARSAFIGVLRHTLDLSYPEIGALMGQHHSTVMHAVARHERRVELELVT